MSKLLNFLFPFQKAYVTLWVKPLVKKMDKWIGKKRDFPRWWKFLWRWATREVDDDLA